MLIALTRGVSSGIKDCLLTYLTRERIDVNKAIAQHRAYEDRLRQLGVYVISLPGEPDLPDAVFIEDPAIVLDEVAVIAMMGAVKRRAEVESLIGVLSQFRPLKFLEPPATLEGGDRMRVDRTLFVGVSGRTNKNAIAQLQRVLGAYDYEVKAVEVSGCLHLTTACSYVGNNTLLLNRSWVDATQFRDFEIIDTPAEEPWAANTIVVEDAGLIVSASFPRTGELLSARGFKVYVSDISELEKAEAGLSCMSLLFECQESVLAKVCQAGSTQHVARSFASQSLWLSGRRSLGIEPQALD
jgi:dimethylargininase